MVVRNKAKNKTNKKGVKLIVDSELAKGAIVHSSALLYRPTKSGGEIQTNRKTGERWLVYGKGKNLKTRELP